MPRKYKQRPNPIVTSTEVTPSKTVPKGTNCRRVKGYNHHVILPSPFPKTQYGDDENATDDNYINNSREGGNEFHYASSDYYEEEEEEEEDDEYDNQPMSPKTKAQVIIFEDYSATSGMSFDFQRDLERESETKIETLLELVEGIMYSDNKLNGTFN